MTKINKPEQVFDVRLFDRHINAGVTTRKDYEAYLKTLSDVADNLETVSKDAVFGTDQEDAVDGDPTDADNQ